MCIVLRKSSSDVSFWIFALDGIIYLSLNNKNSERQGIGLLEYRRNEPRVYLDRMERMLPSKMGIETNERMSSTTTAVTGGRGKKRGCCGCWARTRVIGVAAIGCGTVEITKAGVIGVTAATGTANRQSAAIGTVEVGV